MNKLQKAYHRTEIHDRVRPQVGQYATCTCGFKGSSASFNTHQVAELTALWNLPSVKESS